MLASFMVLNMALPVRDLISLVPRAFFPVAVVTSIAVTYLPTTLRQFQQVREAQAVRGHQMRSLRDWLPLLMPLLVGGMEHAMQLAEAMTARGFASSGPVTGRRQLYPRIAMLLGVVLLTAGWLMQLSLVRLERLVMDWSGGYSDRRCFVVLGEAFTPHDLPPTAMVLDGLDQPGNIRATSGTLFAPFTWLEP